MRRGGFALSEIWVIPDEMLAYVEGAMLDPASRLHAAVHRWRHALSHEGLLLMDLIDLLGQVNSKKGAWKKWPRPFKARAQGKVEKIGRSTMSPSDARAALARNAGRSG